MRTKIKGMIWKGISILTEIGLLTSVLVSVPSMAAYADEETVAPMIVVSMGDSYSSGEGIEPFYGQNQMTEDKVNDNDWLAHRSKNSWPARLEIPGYDGTMKDYKDDKYGICQWYFVAASGAKTSHVLSDEQKKTVRQKGVNDHAKFDRYLPAQLYTLDNLGDNVDYVTISIGGNDVDFAKIIENCVLHSTYLGSDTLENELDALWDNIDSIKKKIKKTYTSICDAAPEADLIVAGYPKLLNSSGKGATISQREAQLVNSNVGDFNDVLEDLVKECREDGYKIHFVDVESTFSDSHRAYSKDAWINPVYLGHKDQELDDKAVCSSYSMHPNERGAQAYAECVNDKIADLEGKKEKCGYITGEVCKASDHTAPISGATLTVYQNSVEVGSVTTDANGHYKLKVPAGSLSISVGAQGYNEYVTQKAVSYRTTLSIDPIYLSEESAELTMENIGAPYGHYSGAKPQGDGAIQTEMELYEDGTFWLNCIFPLFNQDDPEDADYTYTYTGTYKVDRINGDGTAVLACKCDQADFELIWDGHYLSNDIFFVYPGDEY